MQKILQPGNLRLQKVKKACQFLCLPFVFLVLSFSAVLAQKTTDATSQIKGRVIGSDGQSVPGSTIMVKGTKNGTIANGAGEFTLDAPGNAVLVISSIGYDKIEVPVNKQTNIKITLKEADNSLNEVVVVGYGTQSRRTLSGAQTNIGQAELNRTVNSTIEQALQGRAANVFVASNSGKPGAAASVYIRGISSINGNTQPMYVIDGVQIQPSEDREGQSNVLGSLNPDDIESMNVLSGPSAQSIYGSKASNGVIVVTTKKGKSGDAKINFTTQYNLQGLPKMLPMMNLREYAEYSNAWSRELGYGTNPEFADPSILGEGTNWQRELLKTAAMKKNQLAISGGTDKTTYYMSMELLNQEGLAPNSGFNRKSFRLNVESKLRDFLKVGTNFSMSGTSEKLSINDDNIISTAIQQSPSAPLKNADGTWGGPQNITPTSGNFLAITNPVALAYTNTNDFKRVNTFGTVYGDLTFLKNFTFHLEFNGSFGHDTRAIFRPSYQFGANANTIGAVNAITSSERYSGNNFNWSTNQRLNYSKRFNDKHDVNVTVGHEAQYYFYETLSGKVTGYASNNIQELSAGDTKTSISGSGREDNSQESYFSRLGYIYDDKYILQATYRADASSYFGPNNKWGFFPSVSAAWRISKEPFFQNVNFVSDLKLRAEMGTTGNQYWGKNTYAPLVAVPLQAGQGFLAGRFPNPDLKWENTQTINLGFDLGLFKDRLNVVFDAYVRKTDDLITDLPLPAYAGTSGAGSVGAPVVNLGSMENRGLGFSINANPVQGLTSKNINWRTSFNMSFDRNKLLKLYTERAIIDRQPWFTQVISRSVVDQPLWQFYAYRADGLIQNFNDLTKGPLPANMPINPVTGAWIGDIKYVDLTGDNIIDERDKTFIGNPWPKFIFGFTNNFSYRNFDLMVFLQGTYGNQIYNQLRFDNSAFRNWVRGAYKSAAQFAKPNSNVLSEQLALLNPETTVPRLAGGYNNAGRSTDEFIEDGSYLRVKNIQLSYNVPSALLKKHLHINGIKVSGGVQNAFTLTKYSGYDPEVGISAGMPGFDNGRYPSARMYTFSVSADF